MIQFEWKDLMPILAVATLLGGIIIAWVKYRLADAFASRSDQTALSGRVTAMEQRVSAMPTHDDLRGLQQRIGGVEREVAVVGEKVNGATQIIQGVSHQVGLLVHHQINEGAR